MSRHGMGLGFNLNVLTKAQQSPAQGTKISARRQLTKAALLTEQNQLLFVSLSIWCSCPSCHLPVKPHTWEGWEGMEGPKWEVFSCRNPSLHWGKVLHRGVWGLVSSQP